MASFSEGVLWYLAFIVSIVVHEAAHALAALRLGDKTAYEGGQVTLDPLPHIRREPIGTVVIPILSYVAGGWMIGWASTPYDRQWARQYPRRSAMMALAGPLANLAIIVFIAILIRLGLALEWFYPPSRIGFSSVIASYQDGVVAGMATLLSIFLSLNLILLVFNLLPIPPMDGSNLITLCLSRDGADKYRAFVENSTVAFLGLFLAWKIFTPVYHPLHLFALNLIYPGMNYQ